MKRLVILITAVICCCLLFAAPIYKMPLTLTQPNGTEFNCFASGDEYVNWIHDAEGYIIIQNPETGYYCYADTLGDGSIYSTQTIVSTANKDIKGYIKSYYKKRKNESKNIRNSARSTYVSHDFNFPQAKALANGNQVTINNIVVFIRFADQSEFTSDGFVYNKMFNSIHADSVSVKKYFLESSYNKLQVTSFFPQVSGVNITSYQDSHNRSYYCKYDVSTNPNGYTDSNLQNRKMTLFENALNSVKTAIENTFTASQLDADNNGYIDNICFIISGGTEPWAQFLWPHKSYFTINYSIKGKYVSDYNVQIQNHMLYDNYGVVCHEFNHTLGAPDLYHSYNIDTNPVQGKPVGQWCLMANQYKTPQHMCAHIKYRYNHWIDNIPIITGDGTYTLHPLTSSTNNCFRINLQNSSEYLVLEYRKKDGLYENSLLYSGLLVYRIDSTKTGNYKGIGYGGGYNDEVYLYRENGNLNSNGNLSLVTFCQELDRREFHNLSNPNCFLSDGSLGNVTISEVSTCGQTISFNVCFCANDSIEYSNTNNLPANTSANYVISTNGNVIVKNGDNVTFEAGGEIILSDGFEVKSCGSFLAQPGTCIVNEY